MIRLCTATRLARSDEHLWDGYRYARDTTGSGYRAAKAATTLSPASTRKHCSEAA